MCLSFCLIAAFFVVDLLTMAPNFLVGLERSKILVGSSDTPESESWLCYSLAVFTWADCLLSKLPFNYRMKLITFLSRNRMKILLFFFTQIIFLTDLSLCCPPYIYGIYQIFRNYLWGHKILELRKQ